VHVLQFIIHLQIVMSQCSRKSTDNRIEQSQRITINTSTLTRRKITELYTLHETVLISFCFNNGARTRSARLSGVLDSEFLSRHK